MSNPQLILIDKRNQPLKEYIVAVASSDGLDIKGIQLIASIAKGEKALASAMLKIPPLESLEFNQETILEKILRQLKVKDELLTLEQFIDKAVIEAKNRNDDLDVSAVKKSLDKSLVRLKDKLKKIIEEFTNSEVINLIRQRRNDVTFKLKNLANSLSGKNIVCIDIEATDISSNDSADIIQVAICDFNGKKLYNQLINPGYDIQENDKHNITTEMVKDAPNLKDSWTQIHKILQEADVVLAYSTENDFAYLKKSADKKDLDFSLDYDKWLDIAELSKDLIGSLRWQSDKMYWFYKTPKLTIAYEKLLNKPFPENAHDALVDAQASVELMAVMLEKGRKSKVETKKVATIKPNITNSPFALAFAQAKRNKK